ncbi:MAG: TIGR03435 family protein [Candidatus Solibacter sp.]
MQKAVLSASLLFLITCAAFGQGGPTFEAASVKTAEAQPAGMMRVMMRGGPGTPDLGQLTYTNVTLKNVIQNAYNVKGYQINGPKWLDSERYDIVAKIPHGTTKEDFRLMLQNLLAERFKLTLHRESKELPIYSLVVGKNGPKMKEVVDETPQATAPAADGPTGSGSGPSAFAPPPPPSAQAGGGGGGGSFGPGGRGEVPFQIKPNADGTIKLPPGMKGGMMMMMSAGRMHLMGNGQPVSVIIDAISNQVGRPVIDETGLKGKYDIDLEFLPENMQGPMGMGAGVPIGHEGGAGAPMGAAASEPTAPSLSTALKDQLGLNLESKKGPVEMLVIDRLEKTPIEN